MLKVIKYGFPSLLRDNDQFYIEFVLDALKHSDPDAEIQIHKFPTEIKVNIKPSDEGYKKHIIQNLLEVHRLVKCKITFSKSLAISNHISYSIIF